MRAEAVAVGRERYEGKGTARAAFTWATRRCVLDGYWRAARPAR